MSAQCSRTKGKEYTRLVRARARVCGCWGCIRDDDVVRMKIKVRKRSRVSTSVKMFASLTLQLRGCSCGKTREISSQPVPHNNGLSADSAAPSVDLYVCVHVCGRDV